MRIKIPQRVIIESFVYFGKFNKLTECSRSRPRNCVKRNLLLFIELLDGSLANTRPLPIINCLLTYEQNQKTTFSRLKP